MITKNFDKIRRTSVYVLCSLLTPIFLILALEGILRLFFGYPKSLFNNITNGMYAANSTIKMTWGPIPYTVVTNRLGFRGKDFPINKPKNAIRIMAVGDSMTAGFFVDNDATYPFFLDEILNEKAYSGNHVEVINAARGGGSIDMELLVIKEFAIPLHADFVLLTFVDNDIAEIAGKSSSELASLEITSTKSLTTTEWLFTHTALGEVFFDLYLRSQSKKYRAHERGLAPTAGDDRYKIKGGDNFAANVEINKQFMRQDGTVFQEPFPQKTLDTIDNYISTLRLANALCRENGVKLIFVYYPSYIQIYDTNSSMKIRDVLKKACDESAIPFDDLTETFRTKGKHKVLHLAPIDFHLNPAGNRIMAEGITEFLTKNKILENK